MSVKRSVTLLPAPDGGMLLAWPNLNGRLELAHLGVDGEVLSDHAIPLMTKQARDPQLQVGSDGRLLLAAYGLFIATDAVFSVFVMVPRLLWESW